MTHLFMKRHQSNSQLTIMPSCLLPLAAQSSQDHIPAPLNSDPDTHHLVIPILTPILIPILPCSEIHMPKADGPGLVTLSSGHLTIGPGPGAYANIMCARMKRPSISIWKHDDLTSDRSTGLFCREIDDEGVSHLERMGRWGDGQQSYGVGTITWAENRPFPLDIPKPLGPL